MSNPFLFDDEPDVVVPAEVVANPFLLEDTAADAVDENPFATPAANPFAFDDEPEAAAEPPPVEPHTSTDPHCAMDKAMSFFGTTITDEDDEHEVVVAGDAAPIAANEPAKKPPPPRPAPPPNQQTQELISSVADHLDQTSSHMLERIPKTRTPSPVSMRDLHSPSPTPESANLLMSDAFEANPVADNPFVDADDFAQPDLVAGQTKLPPRPVPPRPAAPGQPAEAAAVPEPQEPDLFGFESHAPPKPPAPKSNQDIMSLFSPPKAEPSKPDLLTSDIFGLDVASQPSLPAEQFVQPVQTMQPVQSVQPPVQPLVHPPAPAPAPKRPPVPPPPQRNPAPATASPPAQTSPPAMEKLPSPPAVQARKPSIPRAPSVEHAAPVEVAHSDAVETAAIKINDEPYTAQDNGFADIEKSDTMSDNSSAIESSFRSPGIATPATPFYSGTDPQYLDRGQSPVSNRDEGDPYVNDTSTYVNPTDALNPFGMPAVGVAKPTPHIAFPADDFDAFSAKFDGSGYKSPAPNDAWGADSFAPAGASSGFDADEGFDSFLAMKAPPEDLTTKRALAPPASRGSQNSSIYAEDRSERSLPLSDENKMQRTESQESPSTPLFDDDVSQPLEDFPRITYVGPGWDMQLRQPNKKKITGQRFWKKVFLRIVHQGDTPVVQIFNTSKDKDPFQELPLQGCYSVSDISAQPFDQFGKIFTLKLQYIFYKERPGLRPGQVTKAERITNKLSQFAQFAIAGDYQGVKEFGSDLKKLGLPVEHAPQVSQLFKVGSHNYEDVKQFSVYVEELLFKFNVHRDRALTYKMEEVQVTTVDEFFAEVTNDGHVTRQIARVRLFLLAFLSGMPTIELGVNDLWRQGKEVVGRHDIIPVATEEWIRLEGVEFHSCVQQNEYERSRLIRFQPPDATYIELMRFRVRPPKNRELPLQCKAVWCVTGKRVELRVDVLVPGVTSRKLGQIPCEDVSIRFPIPECWIYLFRVEKHFRYGSVKSAHRRTGKIKGIERILGTVDQVQESLIEVTSGQAKYEHHHRAIVWRCPRLPKDGQGAYTTHQMVVRMALTSYDQIPEKLAEHCFIEYTMPATVVSHNTVRSISVQDSDSDDPPEKYVRYLSRYEYQVGIEYTTGQEQNAYLAATYVKKEEPREEKKPAPLPEASDTDSDSN